MRDVLVPVVGGEINLWHRPPAEGSPTAVLIHGLTGTSRWWIPVISHLPDDLGLLVVDGRGRGQSWRTPPPHGLIALADDSVAAMDHLGIEEVIVAGYSMGAWIAALIESRHPRRVSRLVLVDGGLAGEAEPDLDVEEALTLAVGPSLARLELQFADPPAYFTWWQQHPSLVGRWHDQLEDAFGYDIHQVEGMWRVRADRDAIVEAGHGITVDDETRNAARSVGSPGLLLVVDHGMLDQPGGFIPLERARQAAEDNDNLDVRMHRGLNHFTLMLGDGAPLVADAVARG